MLDLAARVIELTRTIANDFTNRHIKQQLVRAITSSGSNYEEARGAESRQDFIHKLGMAVKELRESIYWLRLIRRLTTATASIDSVIGEADELVAILTASRRTASANADVPHS